MRRFPSPLSVTLPRPSSTTRRLVLTTLAVSFITILALPRPQRKRMTPPLATARTTARDVQLRAVPWPTQRSGCEVLTARASGGTGTAAAAVAGAARRAPQMVMRARRIERPAYAPAAYARSPMPPTSVHFNGSVNLPDGETVMREISSRIPSGVRRMTDGETGERSYWIHFQIQKFLAMQELETVSSGQAYETADTSAPAMPQLRLADG